MRGTTPRLTFDLPFETSKLVVAYITLVQNGETVIEKTLNDCIIGDKSIHVQLTQEETLSLSPAYSVKVQFRGKTIFGDAIKSDIYSIPLTGLLKEGVI